MAGAGGTANLLATLPPTPALVGLELWTQGVRLPGPFLTDGWRKVTVLP